MDKKVQRIEEIFGRVASGDREALQELITLIVPGVRRRIAGRLRAAGVVGDDDRVDDFLLSVRERADEAMVRHRIEAADAQALERFILGMAANVAREEARRLRRLRVALAALAAQADANRHADSTADDVEEAMIILNRLDPHDREIILLEAQGLGVEVIADRVGISAAALRKRLARLKAALREHWRRRVSDSDSGGGCDESRWSRPLAVMDRAENECLRIRSVL